MRLEIIPAGAELSGESEAWERLTTKVVQLDNVQYDFEDLPIGVMKAPVMSIELDFSTSTDDNLLEMLQKPYYTVESYTVSNIFTLSTNYGSGPVDTYVFIGGQSLDIENEYVINHEHRVISVTINSIDIIKLILENTTTKYFADFVLRSYPFAVTKTDNVFITEVLVPSDKKALYNLFPPQDGYTDTISLYSIEQLFNTAVRNYLQESLQFWLSGIDALVEVLNTPLQTIRLYKQDVTYTRGATLSPSEVLIPCEIKRVKNSDSSVLWKKGMLYEDESEESFVTSAFLHELLVDIAESFLVKFKWFCSGSTYVSELNHYKPHFTLGWYSPFQNSIHSTNLPVMDTCRSADASSYKASVASNSFGESECELPNVSDDDISNHSEITTGNPGRQSWSATLLLQSFPNVPTNMGETKYFFGAYNERISLRKMLYYESSTLIPVYARITIDDTIHTVYEPETPPAFPNVTSSNHNTMLPIVKGWCIEVQRNCSAPKAINGWIINTFYSADITKRTLTLEFDGSVLSPWSVGDVFVLPQIIGSAADERSVLLSINADWIKGTAECEFVSIYGE